MSAPVFPGGVAVTDLAVYDSEGPDGCRGGSPHLHTASSEGYVVTAGSGSVQTLSADGYAERALTPGSVVWFSPGTVHRLVDGGGLRLMVVMSNAGLPEAGDAVFTFPSAVLDDPEAYARAAALPVGAPDEQLARAARSRRDLAVEGYTALRDEVADRGPEALSDFHRRAVALVRPRVAGWSRLWEQTVAAETDRTRALLAALAAGDAEGLAAASVADARPVSAERSYGMCGRLQTWPTRAGLEEHR